MQDSCNFKHIYLLSVKPLYQKRILEGHIYAFMQQCQLLYTINNKNPWRIKAQAFSRKSWTVGIVTRNTVVTELNYSPTKQSLLKHFFFWVAPFIPFKLGTKPIRAIQYFTKTDVLMLLRNKNWNVHTKGGEKVALNTFNGDVVLTRV